MAKRKIEVYSAGCPCCLEAIKEIQAEACDSCDVQVKDMHDPAVAAEAKAHGIKRVPAVVINGKLADCCEVRGVDLVQLRSLGLGQPLS
jgi:hypothetical protein